MTPQNTPVSGTYVAGSGTALILGLLTWGDTMMTAGHYVSPGVTLMAAAAAFIAAALHYFNNTMKNLAVARLKQKGLTQ